MDRAERFDAAIKAAIEEWCSSPFQWGTSDCFLSLADIVQQVDGKDPAAEFRGRYRSEFGALRVTLPYGGFSGAVLAMSLRHGWLPINPERAEVGDIGILRGPIGPQCAVIQHRTLWVGRDLHGFSARPTSDVSRAWRVR
jgi:hypothetical protein